MSKILILGDSHGNVYDIYVMQKQAIALNIGIDACIQVGDFGFYPQVFSKFNYKLPLKTYAIDGNHEDHEWLKSQDHAEWEKTLNLKYVPRGTVLDIDGSKIGFCGGALNVDRPQEGSTKKRTTNYILNSEVLEVIDAFNKAGQLDLMVTHSCPHSIGIGMTGHPMFFESITKYCHEKGHETGPNHDCGEQSLHVIWHGLVDKPASAVFGHFHQRKFKDIGFTEFYCVGSCDGSDGKNYVNPFVYDTVSKKVEVLMDESLLTAKSFHSTRLR